MTKSYTPPSGKRLDDGPCPDAGYMKTKMPDKESPNVVDAFDGSKEVYPLMEKDYMDGACGLD
jgi:hypothetical protein